MTRKVSKVHFYRKSLEKILGKMSTGQKTVPDTIKEI